MCESYMFFFAFQITRHGAFHTLTWYHMCLLSFFAFGSAFFVAQCVFRVDIFRHRGAEHAAIFC